MWITSPAYSRKLCDLCSGEKVQLYEFGTAAHDADCILAYPRLLQLLTNSRRRRGTFLRTAVPPMSRDMRASILVGRKVERALKDELNEEEVKNFRRQFRRSLRVAILQRAHLRGLSALLVPHVVLFGFFLSICVEARAIFGAFDLRSILLGALAVLISLFFWGVWITFVARPILRLVPQRKFSEERPSRLSGFSWGLVVVVLLIGAWGFSPPYSQWFLALAVSVPLLLLFTAMVSIPLSYFTVRRQNRRYPLARCLIPACLAHEEVSDTGHVYRGAKNQAARLEALADRLQAAIPRRGDGNWVVRIRVEEAAREIEAYGVWLSLAKSDTVPVVQEKLAKLIFNLATGRLDDLPRLTDEGAATRKPETRRTRLVGAVRTLLVGALPLSILAILKLLNVDIANDFGGTLWLISALWLCVVYLGSLDPALSQKIATLKDVLSTVKDLKK